MNYSWVEVDLGKEYNLTRWKLTARRYTTNAGNNAWFQTGELTLSTHKGSEASGGRCRQWSFGSVKEIEYEMGLSDVDGASPSAAPSPAPTSTPAPTASDPRHSTKAAPNEDGAPSNSSAFFNGTNFLELEEVFGSCPDFLVSFWFKCASDPVDYSWKSWSYYFTEGVSLVDATDEDGDDARDWGVTLTTEGVSFGVGELDAASGDRIIDTVLRSHTGLGKEMEWQSIGVGDSPASDGKWHKVEAKRVGSHVSLSLDGLVVAIGMCLVFST